MLGSDWFNEICIFYIFKVETFIKKGGVLLLRKQKPNWLRMKKEKTKRK